MVKNNRTDTLTWLHMIIVINPLVTHVTYDITVTPQLFNNFFFFTIVGNRD
jgi:hypothetical protein